MPAPILVLQMQRMGDLILTYPLILWLERRFPGHPVWVVAERQFFQPLMPLSPRAAYVDWTDAHALAPTRFRLLINLSHRPEAAALAASLQAEEKIGPLRDPGGVVRIRGAWQLHRASLVHNNRHNRFHWAELNALDCIPLDRVAAASFPQPRHVPGEGHAVGLFLGASETHKRPEPAFWADLAGELFHRGLRPALLGGPGDRELGRAVVERVRVPALDLVGRFRLDEFARVGQTLSLLVVPDTGPMHLAAWTGLRVLNLSMGPVNPWETGPHAPGHFVLRAAMSCVGCWKCFRGESPPCRERFDPRRVAALVSRLTHDDPAARATRLRLPGLRLFQTARTEQGLYDLLPLGEAPPPQGREALSRFWRDWFGMALGLWDVAAPREAWKRLADDHPRLAEAFRKALSGLGRDLAQALRRPAGQREMDDAFWAAHPPLLRPLTGHLHLLLQNDDFSPAAFAEALRLVELARP